jgi:hypothetical protein
MAAWMAWASLAATLFLAAPPVPPAPGAADKALRDVVSYADVDLRWSRGEIAILSLKPGRFKKPTTLPRFRGRFTLILAQGKKSLAEVDFDFPLLHAAESNDATEDSQRVARLVRDGVTAQTTVRVPFPEGADAVWVYDALTHQSRSAEVQKLLPKP